MSTYIVEGRRDLYMYWDAFVQSTVTVMRNEWPYEEEEVRACLI